MKVGKVLVSGIKGAAGLSGVLVGVLFGHELVRNGGGIEMWAFGAIATSLAVSGGVLAKQSFKEIKEALNEPA